VELPLHLSWLAISIVVVRRVQKQSVSNAFQYVVLRPTAPSASDDITAYGQIAAANLDKIFENISQKK